jgi:drug/metabolite transporter (DMT)-like permease
MADPTDFGTPRVPLSALIGWLLYSEQIDVFTACGAALILAGNLLNLQRRARTPRAETVVP